MKIATLTLRLLGYAALLAGVYFVIAYDAAHGFQDETSLIEITQEILLLLMVGISFFCARRYTSYHRFNMLLGVVAFVSLIREFNNFLGEHLFSYAWSILVLIVLLPAAYYFLRNYQGLLRETERIAGTYAFGVLLSGGLVLHVFSRLYGLSIVWMDVMGDAYQRKIARISEESIELLAYAIVFVGVCEIAVLTVAASKRLYQRRKSMVTRAMFPSNNYEDALHS